MPITITWDDLMAINNTMESGLDNKRDLAATLGEAQEVLSAYGISWDEEYELVMVEDVARVKALDDVLNGFTLEFMDNPQEHWDEVSEEVHEYWARFMDGHCDDTYYDYHNSYPGCITSLILEYCEDQAQEDQLWYKYGIPDVISALLEWGNGSGEELFDHLTTKGLTPDEAHTVMNLLNKSCKE